MTAEKKSWTVNDILSWISAKFRSEKIQTPLLDTQILLCHVLKVKSRIDLYIQSERILKSNELSLLREYVKRRLLNEPVAYIINQKYWHHLDLYVDSNVLIPRPETESLLDFVLESVPHMNFEPKIIFDFFTGSGCLAISLGKAFPKSEVYAFDISIDALNIAKKNSVRNEVSNIEFIKLDLTDESCYDFIKSNYSKADILVANPPYVSLENWNLLSLDVKNYEPKIALVSDNNGLFCAQKLYDEAKKDYLLNEKSLFCMELDHKQPEKLLADQSVKKILSFKSQNWEKPMNEWFILKDIENKERFIVKMNG